LQYEPHILLFVIFSDFYAKQSRRKAIPRNRNCLSAERSRAVKLFARKEWNLNDSFLAVADICVVLDLNAISRGKSNEDIRL